MYIYLYEHTYTYIGKEFYCELSHGRLMIEKDRSVDLGKITENVSQN